MLLVACALVDDETEATFKWIYENIKIATGNIVPYSIYTNGDPAKFRAIKSVLDTTVHFICIYHINQNIQKKLKSVLGSNFTQFHKDIYQARNSFNVKKFNFYWEKLKNNYPSAVPYLNRVLDQNRTAWTLCYNCKMFTAHRSNEKKSDFDPFKIVLPILAYTCRFFAYLCIDLPIYADF
ncbi:hypothetical protein RirG_195830 [Rhizophagus irregularis DAOM 197198w]|uniref:MULE transposase domain-containing protein n=1 Tax=Rhizophagus irregularis (strain DAOM 197198w) TaxID=1432141 RepID=A0A015LVN8_RHIIW|nr:hypothetical protein RirG_195830 [Rhizophagus irregularis DAOM 197198w]